MAVCEQCGLAHRWNPLAPGAVARCVRCAAVVGRGHRFGFDAVLALTVTAAVAFLIAMGTAVIEVRLRGAAVAASIPEAVLIAWSEGQRLVALAVAVTAILAPALFIGLRLYVLLPLARGCLAPGFAICVRALHHATRWNMLQVFTIGALLSLVRLAGLADASPGPALFALGALTLLFAAIESAGLKHLWWHVR
ncbi:paraquat-inducible protein A [Piscinibacter koreensis]|uniref:Paraquat-inducible protein A n=1 Tax=Piscinibacter koreensis TaxID=2742824 RepID=A0A7Y6NL37_9BURK|nr:paraquat-inducible protein A [Schlegelella koreensis]NUZ05081.1 paraquat-inducible protein A [Schlegelella koreensis]